MQQNRYVHVLFFAETSNHLNNRRNNKQKTLHINYNQLVSEYFVLTNKKDKHKYQPKII